MRPLCHKTSPTRLGGIEPPCLGGFYLESKFQPCVGPYQKEFPDARIITPQGKAESVTPAELERDTKQKTKELITSKHMSFYG